MISILLRVIYVKKKSKVQANTVDFNQKVKIFKTLNFRYDTET